MATQPVQHDPRLSAMGHALDFLLLSNLNLSGLGAHGPEGNKRLVEFFFTFLREAAPPSIFCDIGANDGSTGAFAKQLFPSARIVGFEANPYIYKLHAARLTAAGITFENLAVSSESGETSIHVPRTLTTATVNDQVVRMDIVEPLTTGKSSLRRRNEEATYDVFEIPCVTLDGYLSDALDAPQDRRDIALWIDVEGAADAVLAGASGTLGRTSAVFIETENHAFWQDQKLSGEVARLLIQQGFLPVRRDREYGDKQFNIVFVHASLVSHIFQSLFKAEAKAAVSTAPAIAREERDPGEPRTVKPCASLLARAASDIPVYIPTFNNPTYVLAMIRQLREWNIGNIMLMDSGSTYGEMLRLLDHFERKQKVIRLSGNFGPRHLLTDVQSYTTLPELFCVTDPDLLFHPDMPQDFLVTLVTLTNRLSIGKAGLALDLSDRHLMKPGKFEIHGNHYEIWEWEQQFWSEKISETATGDPVFKAQIDTTFAVYNKRFFDPANEKLYEGVRIAGRYTCKHLPWYRDNGLPLQEEQFYKQTQKYSFHLR